MHGVAGVSGMNNTVTAVSRMIHSLNILGGNLWRRVTPQYWYISLNWYVCLYTFTSKYDLLSSSFQNILSLLRHHTAMSQREEALKVEISEWD